MEPTKFDMKYAAVRRAIIEQRFSKLNNKQREAVYQTEGPLLILAGAGSGKTTVLINRIINILKFGDGLESEFAPDWATEDASAVPDRIPDRSQAGEPCPRRAPVRDESRSPMAGDCDRVHE